MNCATKNNAPPPSTRQRTEGSASPSARPPTINQREAIDSSQQRTQKHQTSAEKIAFRSNNHQLPRTSTLELKTQAAACASLIGSVYITHQRNKPSGTTTVPKPQASVRSGACQPVRARTSRHKTDAPYTAPGTSHAPS